ncbi:MAG: hypothetical protein UT39_C0008G0043 [Candidatus Woesebacteria bacterium GW2011_GWA1_39_21]|uniref:Uncharacterized protein n=1 Tax=Candidatus Woesebacteria bacterium GW2011_GWA1_39_21 TaxID=1618550 RepID=A0A0G0QLY3_9BACT|nr:MAG: hypothetical protein UT39_C0008G0043 [Candidatus Woesebacteria bacterium GW2011_GWA1_39_21]
MSTELKNGQVVGVVVSEFIYSPTVQIDISKVHLYGTSSPVAKGCKGEHVLSDEALKSGKLAIQYTFPEMQKDLIPEVSKKRKHYRK